MSELSKGKSGRHGLGISENIGGIMTGEPTTDSLSDTIVLSKSSGLYSPSLATPKSCSANWIGSLGRGEDSKDGLGQEAEGSSDEVEPSSDEDVENNLLKASSVIPLTTGLSRTS